jgi:23S rRNA pseudouridine1911/1915/1917 synthase
MAEVHRFVAGVEDAGLRLDRFLSRRLPAFSRSRLQRLIRDGCVHVGTGRPKASQVVPPGAVVNVTIPAAVRAEPEPEPLPLTMLYEDADLAVIDKPAGMVVHPAPGHARGTIVNALLHQVGGLSGIGGAARPGIVHRLDRGTSGTLIVAKHDRAHQALAAQFQQRSVGKEYVALVWGTIRPGLTIEQPIGRHPRDRKRMSGRARRARPAVTRVVSAEPIDGVSLVRVTIVTGRTHQIRVHLAEAGHPIVGDMVYGGMRKRLPPRLAAAGRLTRPFLHAACLTFAHPTTGRTMTVEAPLAADLVEVLEALRRRA